MQKKKSLTTSCGLHAGELGFSYLDSELRVSRGDKVSTHACLPLDMPAVTAAAAAYPAFLCVCVCVCVCVFAGQPVCLGYG